jgi:hypothetical protein
LRKDGRKKKIMTEKLRKGMKGKERKKKNEISFPRLICKELVTLI